MDQQQNQQPSQVTPQQAQTQPVTPAQPAQPVTPVQTTPAETQPAQSAATITPPPANDKSKKKLLVISSIIIVALFLIAGILYISGVVNKTKRIGLFTNNGNTAQQQIQKTQPVKQVQEPLSQEEKDAAAIDTGDPAADIKDLNQDLNTLGQ